jgi:hypothetical protein
MASMDGHRFDTLTRTLATGTSRRDLLGGLLGLVALSPLRAAAQGCAPIGPGAYLAGCDLSGLDLAGVNLAGANLRGANLTGTTLDGANLSGANLSNATLTVGALDHANTAGANLWGIRWVPEPCPPFTTRIDGICQHPCPNWQCQCADGPSICLASVAGEALCNGTYVHGVGFACQSDQDCQDAFGGYNETTGPNDFTYVCQQSRPDHPGGGGGTVCYGNYAACAS